MHADLRLSPQVEFHTSQDDSQRPRAARIHHCLLRVQKIEDMQALTKNLTTISDTLSQFVHLETIVLETGHELKIDNVQLLIDALRKVSRVEVQHRTCDDGHKLALQVKKSPARSMSAELLSPLWCLKEYTWRWDDW